MSSTPIFGVITVVLNDLPGLRATRASLEAQDFHDYEHVIIDGVSTDGSREFIGSLSPDRLRWVSEQDRGIYDAMNKGTGHCRARYVVFLNAGDRFPATDTLSRVWNRLQAENEPDLLCAGANLRFANGPCYYRPPRKIEDYIWHGLPANHQAVYFKRDRLQNEPYDLQYRICGDYYLIATLFRKGARCSYLDVPVADFRAGDRSFRRPIPLFAEPYRIQRDVLGTKIWSRIGSLGKRFISTLGMAAMVGAGFLTKRRYVKGAAL